jgi:hypothetical protein
VAGAFAQRGVPMRNLMLLVASLVLLSPLGVGVAQAAEPAQVVIPINETFTDNESCDFPVVVHLEGTRRATDFFDQNGNLIRTLSVYPGLTISFSANDKTLTSATPAIDIATINADGTVTVFIAGLLAHISVPGQGIVAINTGLRIYLFTEQGPEVIFRAGASTFDTFEGPLSQLCGVLADP